MNININNVDVIIEELKNMLMNFAKEMNKYHTDVYMYLDEKRNGRLKEFVNVGNNSWLDDDHITIYTDNPHYEDVFDVFLTIDEIANCVNMSERELKILTAKYFDIDEDDIDDITYHDVTDYVKSNDSLMEMINNAYCDYVDENENEYYNEAVDIITELEI